MQKLNTKCSQTGSIICLVRSIKQRTVPKNFLQIYSFPPQLSKFRKPPPTRRLFDAKKEVRISGLPDRGASRNRTGDKGFADPCLTAWLRRHMKKTIQDASINIQESGNKVKEMLVFSWHRI